MRFTDSGKLAILTLVVAVTLIRRGEPAAADEPVCVPPGGRRTVRILVAGTAIGQLTGFFGVGGGFIVVPALVFALGFPLPMAVGTSLLVVAMTWPWRWLLAWPQPVSTGASPFPSRVNARLLGRGLAVLLVGVGLYVGARALAS